MIDGRDILKDSEKVPGFLGFNELARENCVYDFLHQNYENISSLLQHKLTIDLITASYLSIANKRNGRFPHSQFAIDGSIWKIDGN